MCMVDQGMVVTGLSGFLSGSGVRNLPANAGDSASIPGSERSPGGGNGYLLVFLPGKSHGQSNPAGYI